VRVKICLKTEKRKEKVGTTEKNGFTVKRRVNILPPRTEKQKTPKKQKETKKQQKKDVNQRCKQNKISFFLIKIKMPIREPYC
jgi:hypothetical protein